MNGMMTTALMILFLASVIVALPTETEFVEASTLPTETDFAVETDLIVAEEEQSEPAAAYDKWGRPKNALGVARIKAAAGCTLATMDLNKYRVCAGNAVRAAYAAYDKKRPCPVMAPNGPPCDCMQPHCASSTVTDDGYNHGYPFFCDQMGISMCLQQGRMCGSYEGNYESCGDGSMPRGLVFKKMRSHEQKKKHDLKPTPRPTPAPTQTSPYTNPKCAGWCHAAKHAATPWSEKCAWKSKKNGLQTPCSGCDECTGFAGCKVTPNQDGWEKITAQPENAVNGIGYYNPDTCQAACADFQKMHLMKGGSSLIQYYALSYDAECYCGHGMPEGSDWGHKKCVPEGLWNKGQWRYALPRYMSIYHYHQA